MADPSLKRLPLNDVIKQGMLALVITAVSSLPAQAAADKEQASTPHGQTSGGHEGIGQPPSDANGAEIAGQSQWSRG